MLCGMVCVCGAEPLLPFLLSAALHEGGHLLALWLLGIPVEGVELRFTGAVIRAELRGAGREVWAILAGPAGNLLLAGAFYRLWPLLSFSSAVLLCCNLLPICPLDGGRLCLLVLPRLFGRAGLILCKLLSVGTVLAILLAGVWGTCVLHLGLLPALTAVFFLLKLSNVLDKGADCW